jgi:hypothetical protein
VAAPHLVGAAAFYAPMRPPPRYRSSRPHREELEAAAGEEAHNGSRKEGGSGGSGGAEARERGGDRVRGLGRRSLRVGGWVGALWCYIYLGFEGIRLVGC